jgi:hypothetical protein
MRKALLVVVSAVGLCACGFPQTKMEEVGETQMQTQKQLSPDQQSQDQKKEVSQKKESATSS